MASRTPHAQVADANGIATVYRVCAWLPLPGVATILLPDTRRGARP